MIWDTIRLIITPLWYRAVVRRGYTGALFLMGGCLVEQLLNNTQVRSYRFITQIPVFIAEGWVDFCLVNVCSPVSLAININSCDGNKARLISLLLCDRLVSTSHGDNHGETIKHRLPWYLLNPRCNCCGLTHWNLCRSMGWCEVILIQVIACCLTTSNLHLSIGHFSYVPLH